MHQDQGGKCVELQGIKCYLLPQPPLHEIHGYNLPKRDQKWRRTELPVFRAKDVEIFSGTKYKPNDILTWDDVKREEEIKNSGHDPWDVDRNRRPKQVAGVDPDISYRMQCLSAFRKQELDRMRDGFWFMNNGEPTYITGINYMFLNWWRLDDGYPVYRRYIRELMYVVEVVRYDPTLLGLILLSMRGIGKTYMATCIAYTIMMFTREGLGGMQSKNDDAGESMYELRLCNPVYNLPEFLVPIHEWSTEIPDEMKFRVGKKQHPNLEYDTFLRSIALNSRIDHRNASFGAYDQETTTVLLEDEIGKISNKVDGNVLQRFNKIRFCVQRGSTKRGIIFGFTTCGNMEREGGVEFQKLWKQSDQSERDELGYTENAYIRYFISALEATVFDEYGEPVIDRPKDKRTIDYIKNDKRQGPQFIYGSRYYHDMQKEKLYQKGMAEGDLSDYIDYCQNNPYNSDEAFQFSGKSCLFNQSILQTAQHKINTTSPDLLRRSGYFEWVIKDQEVRWVDDPLNARAYISMMPDGKVWIPNKVKRWEMPDGTLQFYPTNDKFASSGYDPFSHKDVVEANKASKAGFTVRTKFNFHWKEEDCYTPIFIYKHRHQNPKDAHEDIIMACFYFGVSVLIETNQGGANAIDYMEGRGYGPFVMSRPQSSFTKKDQSQANPGMPSSSGVIGQYTELADIDITENGHKWKHKELVDDALNFDPKKPTKFDVFVSYGYSLIAAQKRIDEEPESFDLSKIIPTYKLN